VFDDAELNRLFRYCRALTDSEADAFDLLQGGMERCLRTPPADSERRIAYAMKIMSNLWRDGLRRERVVHFEPLDDEPTALDPALEGLEAALITRDELDHAWRELREDEREILFLWAVEGYTLAEVAIHLDRPKGSVLSIVHRMRRRLRPESAKEISER